MPEGGGGQDILEERCHENLVRGDQRKGLLPISHVGMANTCFFPVWLFIQVYIHIITIQLG